MVAVVMAVIIVSVHFHVVLFGTSCAFVKIIKLLFSTSHQGFLPALTPFMHVLTWLFWKSAGNL
jgi:hypothetical protein